ncbi:MAG TPA: two pore domain potassium channel family protein [Intrasporangiaceae bacterium]|nr:two pore domain potassium channel family protein [Intrasporangiaceae bacterium]
MPLRYADELDNDPFASPSRFRRLLALAKEQPSAVLLFVQIGGLLLFPFLQPTTFGRVSVSIFGAIVLLLALWTVRSTPALTWMAILIGVPAVILEIWGAVDRDMTFAVIGGHFLLGIFYFYTAYALVAYMFEDHWVTKDEVFAAGATFTVIAWGFAYLYMATQNFWPGSFVSSSGDEILTWQEMLFVSVSNFTSVGLSDVVPVKPHAQSLVMLEQIGGVLYIAMVISRLVALTVLKNR